MRITKDEIAKINKFRKILEANYSIEEIEQMNAGITISKDLFIIAIKENDYFIQCQLNIEESEDLKVSTTLGELLNVAKTFTKKSEIDFNLEDCSLKFSGMQDKELKEYSLPIKFDNLITAKINIPDMYSMISLDLLSGLIASYKLSKKMEAIDVEALIKVSQKNNCLRLFANGQSEVLALNYDCINDNAEFFIEKDKIKTLYTLIQETKSFEIEIKIMPKMIVVKSDYIIFMAIKSSKPGLDLENLVNTLEEKMNFENQNVIIDEKSITLRNGQERIVYLNNNSLKSDNINEVFSDISIINSGYSDKRLTELLKIKSIEDLKVFKGDKDILKLENNYLRYYLLPQKKD